MFRRAEQLVLYARSLELLSASLDMAKTEILADRLKPSNTVRNGKFFVCLVYFRLYIDALFCESKLICTW